MTEDHARLLARATLIAVLVPAGLAAAKAAAWLLSGSVAVLASLIDSLADMLMSGLTLLAVRLARKPADAEHRFGHGKVEPLAGLIQAAFVLGSAVVVAFEAVRRMEAPQPLERSGVAIGVMVLSIAATTFLVLYQRRVAHKTGSLAVKGDSLHYTGDILANLSVIAGIVLTTAFGWWLADPIIGLGVAAVLVWGALAIARQALRQLMDRELSDEDRARILEIARADPEVVDVHALRTRQAGHQRFIQLDLIIDGATTLQNAHDVGERVADRLRALWPGAEVLVHHDPSEPGE